MDGWETLTPQRRESDGWETLPAAAPAPASSDTAVVVNAANKGIAGLPDMLLNAPNRVLNLGRALFGTGANLLGRSDLAPDLVPDPDLTRRGAEAIGAINPNVVPQGGVQKGLDIVTQGIVGGALSGGTGLPRVAMGAAAGGLSSAASGTAQALGADPALVASAGLLPGGAAGGRVWLSNPQKTAMLKSQNTVKDETWAAAQKEGYVAPPSSITGGSFLGNRVESIGGKAALGQEAALHNQPITNKIARREAGLAEDSPISEGTLAAARDNMAGPYREVAALNPMGAKALELLKQARADAKIYWNHYGRSADPTSLKQAQALDNKAQMYESVIDKIAARQGKPGLVDELRDARVAMAKNHDVDRALNVGTGDVDARVIGRMYDKSPGRFTGGLETIGRFANAFGHYARDASGVQAPGVSKLEGVAGAAAAVAGHALIPGAGGFLMGAVPIVAPPAARALALSPMMQGGRQYGPGPLSDVLQRTSPIATGLTLSDLLRQQQ